MLDQDVIWGMPNWFRAWLAVDPAVGHKLPLLCSRVEEMRLNLTLGYIPVGLSDPRGKGDEIAPAESGAFRMLALQNGRHSLWHPNTVVALHFSIDLDWQKLPGHRAMKRGRPGVPH